jgi:hypothetical protein
MRMLSKEADTNKESSMSDSQEDLVPGRTRWRRFAVMMAATVSAAGAIVLGMANGAIAASFSVSGQSFKISADHLHGDGFSQFSGVDTTTSGTPIPVATSVINKATLTNLCQSVNVPNPFGLKIVLRIEAGKGTTPVSATGLVIGMTRLDGDATFTNIQIGRDGGELSGNAKLNGTFGQSAEMVDIDHLQQTATSTSAGTFALTGLTMQVQTGANAAECF